ncbi:TetR family transcriptional regulator C-terminal domain-containing protein [Streptomyces inhibens]|uniref:TetR family transcriptional regulator C-terminal domain-containing protein n=1 Tax=Streptomyces inhibens TaxID=2293571 RepID=UPI0037B7D89C
MTLQDDVVVRKGTEEPGQRLPDQADHRPPCRRRRVAGRAQRAQHRPAGHRPRAEQERRPDALRNRQHQNWLARLADELRQAVDAGEIADLDSDLVAFQIDAVLTAANTAVRLGDGDAVNKVRRVVDGFLTPRG